MPQMVHPLPHRPRPTQRRVSGDASGGAVVGIMNLKGESAMLTKTESARFQALRDQSLNRALSLAEAAELKQLESALLQEEAKALSDSNARIDRNIKELDAENRKLAEVLSEKEA